MEAVAAGVQPDRGGRAGRLQPHGRCKLGEGGGRRPAARKKAVYLPFDRKMELVARLEAGERAADLAAEAGVTAAAVSGWRRRLREEGALSLMTDSDIAARAAGAPRGALGARGAQARCEELELRNAVLEGTIDILKKDPGADLSALTAAERAALADRLRGRFGLRAALAALSLPRSTFYDRLAAASAPDPYAALRAPWSGPPSRRPGAPTATARPRRARAGRRRAAAGPAARRGSTRRGRGRSPRRWCAGSWPRRGCAPRAPRAAPLQLLRRRGGAARRRPNLLLVDAGRDLHDFSAAAPGEVLVTDITEFQAARRPAEGVPLAGRRPVRRRRRRLLGGHLAVQGARGRDARRRRGRRRGRLHAPQRPRLALPHPPTGSAPAGRPGWRGRCRARGTSPDNAACEGFLRQAQGRVLPPGGTGAGSPPSGSPPSSPSGSAGTGRGG